jgi:hypothetical protein
MIDPKLVEQARVVGQHVRMEIRTYKGEGRAEIRFIKIDPAAPIDLDAMVDSMVGQLASLFSSMLGIKGKIIETRG